MQAALEWAVEHAQERRQAAIELHEVLGDLLELIGHHDEAVNAYRETSSELPEHEVLWRARLPRKVGEVLRIQNFHQEALQAFDAAETLLNQGLTEAAPEWWQERIEIQLNRIWLYYRYRRQHSTVLHEMTELAEKTRPIAEQHGMPVQRARFLQSLMRMSVRKEQYVASEETVDIALSALSESRESRNLSVISMSQFDLGFCYLWAGRLDEAEEPLQAALTLSEQVGDIVLQTRSLTYLAELYRKCGQVEAVRNFVPRCLHAAEMAHMPEYIAAARANRAWVAWHEGDLAEAEKNARTAFETWRSLSFMYAFQWTALWPLIGVALAQNRTADVVGYAQALLDPSQQRLPNELMTLLKGAVRQWEEGEADAAWTAFDQALALAREWHYL